MKGEAIGVRGEAIGVRGAVGGCCKGVWDSGLVLRGVAGRRGYPSHLWCAAHEDPAFTLELVVASMAPVRQGVEGRQNRVRRRKGCQMKTLGSFLHQSDRFIRYCRFTHHLYVQTAPVPA